MGQVGGGLEGMSLTDPRIPEPEPKSLKQICAPDTMLA